MQAFPSGWTGARIVFLDCDSTLSAVEGIDELARRKGVDVAALTAAAMAGTVPLQSVYRRRLELIRPDEDDFIWLADRYARTTVPGAVDLVAALARLEIPCHVISGGLRPAVLPFALSIGFTADRVHAVDYPLDAPDPVDTACAHPLARDGGKPATIATLCTNGPARSQRMLVGDGTSDLEAGSECGLFVGFGGVVDRPEVRRAAPVFLATASLGVLAGFAAGPKRLAELERVAPALHDQFLRGLDSSQQLVIREP
jgi:phosphoserine phosphatase